MELSDEAGDIDPVGGEVRLVSAPAPPSVSSKTEPLSFADPFKPSWSGCAREAAGKIETAGRRDRDLRGGRVVTCAAQEVAIAAVDRRNRVTSLRQCAHRESGLIADQRDATRCQVRQVRRSLRES